MKTYYYVDSLNTTQGPVSLSDLEKLHMEKTITSTTEINEVGSEGWIPFYQVNLEKPSTESTLKDHSSPVITSEDRQKIVLLKKEKKLNLIEFTPIGEPPIALS